MVTTTHFLKKCVKVPKIEPGDFSAAAGSNYSKQQIEIGRMEKTQKQMDSQQKNAF